ncbi:N-acetyltransferase [Arthrobacter sp. zg-Y462]|uniref:N-acetyltransferase n=2 Tax=Arthrobacter zhangbolii TaxID=2886936 RepID=A0A9X1MBM9_9MICC|nr:MULTISPECIES: GNAT family N-acetyltransferase [Arthrobacter]MCC3274162.1 N-acetyltransferase [Arthrobacter zhangbolii]MCC3294610.1 N-acetyltransferase [Arthrobacter zhangbolii]MDN3902968.1 GNAT family N-acetyltransferase [Arthrobacter sp. YD2]
MIAWQSRPMTSKDISVSRNDGLDRYELRLDGELVGVADYERQPDAVALTHTEMEPAYRHQGYSSKLARYAVEDIVSEGKRVKPYCSYMATYLGKHPEYSHHVSWPQE